MSPDPDTTPTDDDAAWLAGEAGTTPVDPEAPDVGEPESSAPPGRRGARWSWRRALAFSAACLGAPFVAAGCVIALLLAASHPGAGPSLFISPLLPVAMAVVAIAAMTLFVRRSARHSRIVWAAMAIGACFLSIVVTMIAFTFVAGLQSGLLGLYLGGFGTLIAALSFCALGGPLWAAAGVVASARIVGAGSHGALRRAGWVTAGVGALLSAATVLGVHGLRAGDDVVSHCGERSLGVPPGDAFTGGWSWFPLGWDCSWDVSGGLAMAQWPTGLFAIGIGLAVLGLALGLTGLEGRHGAPGVEA